MIIECPPNFYQSAVTRKVKNVRFHHNRAESFHSRYFGGAVYRLRDEALRVWPHWQILPARFAKAVCWAPSFSLFSSKINPPYGRSVPLQNPRHQPRRLAPRFRRPYRYWLAAEHQPSGDGRPSPHKYSLAPVAHSTIA